MKKQPVISTPESESALHIETQESFVNCRIGVGTEGRLVSSVLDGSTLIAEFMGATAPIRAEECLKIAEDHKKRGLPLKRLTKCVADGVSLKAVCKDNVYKQEGLFVE